MDNVLLGPLGGYALAIAVIGGLLRLYQQSLKDAREDREKAEVRNDARWSTVQDLNTAVRESNALVRQSLEHRG